MASSHDPEIEKAEAAGAIPQTTTTVSASSINHGVESISEDALDDNYQVFKATANIEVDPKEAKRVVRKIDWRVVPILFVTYMLQYLDKSECPDTGTYLESRDCS